MCCATLFVNATYGLEPPAEDNRRCFTFCASVRACPGHKARVRVPIRTVGLNVDNVASLRPSQPSVSARSLTGRENTRRRSAGDEATLAPARARDFYCFFFSPPFPPLSFFIFFFPPRDEAPISRLEPFRARVPGLYKYACRCKRRRVRRRRRAGRQVCVTSAGSACQDANATNVGNNLSRGLINNLSRKPCHANVVFFRPRDPKRATAAPMMILTSRDSWSRDSIRMCCSWPSFF